MSHMLIPTVALVHRRREHAIADGGVPLNGAAANIVHNINHSSLGLPNHHFKFKFLKRVHA
jgi:hypothetical protein